MQTDNLTLGDFLRHAFPWTIDVEWFGAGGVHAIDDDRRAEIDAHQIGINGGEKNGVLVKIMSKTSGEITRRTFKFDDFMRRTERADNHPADYPLGQNECFVVLEHIGPDWYIAQPAKPEDFAAAVEQFIEMYR